jgi:hypothetical protein
MNFNEIVNYMEENHFALLVGVNSRAVAAMACEIVAEAAESA